MKITKPFKLNRTDRSWNYEKISEIAQDKIIKLVQREGIKFKKTYEAARTKNAHYQQKYDYVDNLMQKSIIMPKYSDNTVMQQVIIIAHELGHYAVYKNSSPRIFSFLVNGGKYITYLNEYLAWKKAKSILKKMKIWKVGNVEGQFKNIMYSSLNTYKPSERFSVYVSRQILKTIFVLLKYGVISYFSVGLLHLFYKNDIPIPIHFLEIDVGTSDTRFYVYVFIVYIVSLIIKYNIAKLDKNK